MATARPAPSQPTLRCRSVRCAATSAGCTTRSTSQAVNATPCTEEDRLGGCRYVGEPGPQEEAPREAEEDRREHRDRDARVEDAPPNGAVRPPGWPWRVRPPRATGDRAGRDAEDPADDRGEPEPDRHLRKHPMTATSKPGHLGGAGRRDVVVRAPVAEDGGQHHEHDRDPARRSRRPAARGRARARRGRPPRGPRPRRARRLRAWRGSSGRPQLSRDEPQAGRRAKARMRQAERASEAPRPLAGAGELPPEPRAEDRHQPGDPHERAPPPASLLKNRGDQPCSSPTSRSSVTARVMMAGTRISRPGRVDASSLMGPPRK